MLELQHTHSSSVVFDKILSLFQSDFEYETVVDEVSMQRNLAETSTILHSAGSLIRYAIQIKLEDTSATFRDIEYINLLKKDYLFKEAKEIETYLWNNKFLLDILLEAHLQITNIFGRSSELYLELHRDYEEDFEELFIIIKAPFEPAQMLNLLDRLDDDWFLDITDKTQGKLNVTVESL